MQYVDETIVSAYLQLANFMAEQGNIKPITEMFDLWTHGMLIAKLLNCNVDEIESSKVFYEALFRKISFTNGAMSAALNPQKAASGELLEICKFYTLVLEHLRKEHGDMLKQIIETLTKKSGFDGNSISNVFSHFDKLYETDCVDDWWSILRSNIQDTEVCYVGTPTNRKGYLTPSTSVRRIRSVRNSMRRSPIVDSIDSPTMKAIRAEREAKRTRKLLQDCEMKLDDALAENTTLNKENRSLRMTIDELRSCIAGEKCEGERVEQLAEEYAKQLESKAAEVEELSKLLTGARQNTRSFMKRVEEADYERNELLMKINDMQHDKETLMREIRDLRDATNENLEKWNEKEREMATNLQLALSEIEKHKLECETARADEVRMQIEIDRLRSQIDAEQSDKIRLSTTIDGILSEKEKQANNYLETIEQIKQDKEREENKNIAMLKMKDATIERLKKELDVERNEMSHLKDLFNSLNEKMTSEDLDKHERTEHDLNMRACLESAKSKIELLEYDVASKNQANESLKTQINDMQDILKKEEEIRTSTIAQSALEIENFKKKITENEQKMSEIVKTSNEELKKTKEEYFNKLKDLENQFDASNKIAAQLESEKKELSEKLEEKNKEIQYYHVRVNPLKKEPLSSRRPILRTTCSSFEKILEQYSDEFGIEEPKSQAPQSKNVSFSFAHPAEKMNLPPGMKFCPTTPRPSISSNSDLMDRSSILRSSITSESSLKKCLKMTPDHSFTIDSENVTPAGFSTMSGKTKLKNRRTSLASITQKFRKSNIDNK